MSNRFTTHRYPVIAVAAAALILSAQLAGAVSITLDYNGFNPGENVTVRSGAGTSFPTVIDTQTAAVAGDSATTFVFDLTVVGEYAIDLFGNVSTSANRATHQVSFNFDGSQITGILNGSEKITGFAAGTSLTLNTIDVYIDPQGYNPPNDANNGYVVQAEVGGSGRIDLDDVSTFQNGGQAVTLLNDLNYMVQYNDTFSGNRSMFRVDGGVVEASDALIDAGSTVNSTGGSGATHQLARLNTATITVDTNGLSYALPFADNRGYVLQNLPADFNGNVEVLAGDLPASGASAYRLDLTNRHAFNQHIQFDVDDQGNIASMTNPDDRIESITDGTIKLRTRAVHINTVNEAETYNLAFKLSQTNPNFTNILTGISGDTILTLLPNLDSASATYYINNTGNLTSDARDSWRLEYDDITDQFVLATWADAAGTTKVTDPFVITLFGSGVVISIPEPASALMLAISGSLLSLRRHKRDDAERVVNTQ